MRLLASLGLLILPHFAHAATPEVDACLTRHKTPETAVAACTQAVAAAPADDLLIKVLTARGYAYYSQGKADLALQDFDKAFPMTDKDPLLRANVQLERGMIRLKFKKFEEAASDLESVKTAQPAWAEPHFALAYLKQAKGDAAGAKAAYDAAEAIDYVIENRMADSWGLVLGSREELEQKCMSNDGLTETSVSEASCASLLDAPALTADVRAAILFFLASARRNNGKYSEALSNYDESIKISSSNPYAYSGRGKILADQGKLDAALNEFNQAIKLAGDSANLFVNRGETYAKKGDQENALKDFDRAVTLEPENGDILITRGKTLAAQGRYDAAVQDYERAAKTLAPIENPWTGIGCARFLQGDYAKAIAAFDEAIKDEKDEIWAWYGRGLAKQILGDAAGAKADMDFARSRNSDIAAIMYDDWGVPPKPKTPKKK